MCPRKRDEVENGLKRKGFQESSNDHRKFIYYTISSSKKTSVWTKTSHGSGHREISDDNLRNMSRQCKLTNREFDALIECPLSQIEYENKLKASGDIH